MDFNAEIEQIMNSFEIPDFTDLPELDLYMDQVTTYLDEKFEFTKRYEDDKLLTKTMINNYAKSRLLPPPEKKKYSSDHVRTLALIFFFKNVLSISDVDTLLKPLLSRHFHNDQDSLSDIVDSMLKMFNSKNTRETVIRETKAVTGKKYAGDNEYETLFLVIASLSYDIYMRKFVIEKLIDRINDETKKRNGISDENSGNDEKIKSVKEKNESKNQTRSK